MSHLNTEQLIEYWRARRGGERTPHRSSIDPTHLAHLLPQIFMLGRAAPGQYHFRLVGGFVADLHGRDLRQDDFLRLWRAEDRTALQLALEASRRRAEPVVVDGDAHPRTGGPLRMEIAVAPLVGPLGEINRFIGLYQPLAPVAALLGRAALSLSIRGMTMSDSAGETFPRLRLAAMHGRRIA